MGDEDFSLKVKNCVLEGDFEKFSNIFESVGPFNIIMAIEDLGDELIEDVFGEISFEGGLPKIKDDAFINNFNVSQDSMLFGDTADTSPNILLFYEKVWERKLYLEFSRVHDDKENTKILTPPVLESVLNPALISYIEDQGLEQTSIFAEGDFIKDNGAVFFVESIKIIIERGGMDIFVELFDLVSDATEMAKVLRNDPTFWARVWVYISFNKDEGKQVLKDLISRSIVPRLDDQLKYHSVNLPEALIKDIEKAQGLIKD